MQNAIRCRAECHAHQRVSRIEISYDAIPWQLVGPVRIGIRRIRLWRIAIRRRIKDPRFLAGARAIWEFYVVPVRSAENGQVVIAGTRCQKLTRQVRRASTPQPGFA